MILEVYEELIDIAETFYRYLKDYHFSTKSMLITALFNTAFLNVFFVILFQIY